MPRMYVILKLDGGELISLLFPEFMQHSAVAQAVPATMVSAGRVHLEGGKIVASGASSSLEASSRDEDGKIIQGDADGQSVIQQEFES